MPLYYRGITLLSTVNKVYSAVVNTRNVSALESNDILVDEQNGFRRKRSCNDHLFKLTTIIRNRKRKKLATFLAFVDFEKAFDRVDRALLLHKLGKLGLGPKILSSISNIYSSCQSCVILNRHLTESFPSQVGVRQGDTLSPTLFNIYINDLAECLNNSRKGIKLNESLEVTSLFYADDLVIMAETNENLQSLLNILHKWCQQWRMSINIGKTKVIHFRNKTQVRSNFTFKVGNANIEMTDKYKYLGLILDEHLDFSNTASFIAGSAGRALGAVCTKFSQMKGMGYNTYTKLYETGVAPILDYGSDIWGFQKFSQISAIQNRAIRFFLGTHRFASNVAVNGDMGWTSCETRRHIAMLRFWNRVIGMEDDRLTKKIFMWDYQERRSVGSWNSDVFKIFDKIGKLDIYQNRCMINIQHAKTILKSLDKHVWSENVEQLPKLRFYRRFKFSNECDPYVYKVSNRAHRSIMAQLRSGVLPLRVETGRFTQIPLEFRLCIFCESNNIEDEVHFIFECSLYDNIRRRFFDKLQQFHPSWPNLNVDQKLLLLMSKEFVKDTAEFVHQCFVTRRKQIYQ